MKFVIILASLAFTFYCFLPSDGVIGAATAAGPPVCGNGIIEDGENCWTCPEDWGDCPMCYNCFEPGVCLPDAICPCGDGVQDPGENCSNCPDDAPCPTGELCVNGECILIDPPPCVPEDVPVEIVFVMDTSGSMEDEAEVLCNAIEDIVLILELNGVQLNVFLFSISNDNVDEFPCLTASVNDLYNLDLYLESWGEAVSVLSTGHAWGIASRLIIPLSDEGPHQGDPCWDPGSDRDTTEQAIVDANENNVIVSPIIGTPNGQDHIECVLGLATDMAEGTGGTWFLSVDPKLDLPGAIFDIITQTLCTCEWDLDGDGVVGIGDFLLMLGLWNNPYNITDFLDLLANWGPCDV